MRISRLLTPLAAAILLAGCATSDPYGGQTQRSSTAMGTGIGAAIGAAAGGRTQVWPLDGPGSAAKNVMIVTLTYAALRYRLVACRSGLAYPPPFPRLPAGNR